MSLDGVRMWLVSGQTSVKTTGWCVHNADKSNTNGCKAQTRFTPVLSSPHTRTDNWQVLKLHELVGTDQVCNISYRYFTILH